MDVPCDCLRHVSVQAVADNRGAAYQTRHDSTGEGGIIQEGPRAAAEQV